MPVKRKIRVLIAKPGLDGHDRGAKVVARSLRDAGFEVVYTGLHQTHEQIVAVASQEDVDVIGLSILAGGQVPLITSIVDLMKKKGLSHVLLMVGGIVPKTDRELLEKLGVAKIFGPGTHTQEIVDFIKENVPDR